MLLYKYVLSWPGVANITTAVLLVFLVTVVIAFGIKAGESAWHLLMRRPQPAPPDRIDLAYEELCRNPE